MAMNKRMRGIAVDRPLLIGSTATPLTPAEKMSADPLHTHKWTVAVRSAASNPLPSHIFDENGAALPAPTPSASSGAAAGTRGRDTETDYHKHVGGKDDISHFIRRVQFKLHDSFPQPMRTCDRPPYQVSETGWGEFEIQVKIWWVAESGEKPLQTFHYLKLHPWHPFPVSAASVAAEAGVDAAAEPSEPEGGATALDGPGMGAAQGVAAETTVAATTSGPEPAPVQGAQGAVVTPKVEGDDAGSGATTTMIPLAPEQATAEPTAEGADAVMSDVEGATVAPAPAIVLPPVVHSWQYDEVVFPEPTESFYQVLINHPPTPLPASATQAFTDPKTSRLQHGFNAADDGVEIDGAANPSTQPPYPLHAPSSQAYVHGISQQSVQAEADRLDIARVEAVQELERERTRLIDAEKELRTVRAKAEALTTVVTASTAGAAVTAGNGGK
ncbi:unnamed protein product [Parajaminaea phylloscopi]